MPFGGVSPSWLVLAPGRPAVVRVTARVPGGGGRLERVRGVRVQPAAGPAGGPVSVPVTLRGLVPTGLGLNGTFSGVLTGGNGRSPGEGQVAAYSFTVPSDLPVLLRNIDVDVMLANDPANQVSGYLVAPGGETMGYGSNYLTTGFNGSGVPVESPQAAAVAVHVQPGPRQCGRSSSTSPRRCPATSSPTRSPGGSGSTPCRSTAGSCPTRPRSRCPAASR